MTRKSQLGDKPEKNKRFPNSVAKTILAIVRWLKDGELSQTQMTTPEFIRQTTFSRVYESTIHKFGAVHKKPEATQDALVALMQALARGGQSLDFPKQQAIADYLETPLGLLFYFTRLVADECKFRQSNRDFRGEVRRRARALRAYADQLERLAETTQPFIFAEPHAKEGYRVNAHALKVLTDSYKSAF